MGAWLNFYTAPDQEHQTPNSLAELALPSILADQTKQFERKELVIALRKSIEAKTYSPDELLGFLQELPLATRMAVSEEYHRVHQESLLSDFSKLLSIPGQSTIQSTFRRPEMDEMRILLSPQPQSTRCEIAIEILQHLNTVRTQSPPPASLDYCDSVERFMKLTVVECEGLGDLSSFLTDLGRKWPENSDGSRWKSGNSYMDGLSVVSSFVKSDDLPFLKSGSQSVRPDVAHWITLRVSGESLAAQACELCLLKSLNRFEPEKLVLLARATPPDQLCKLMAAVESLLQGSGNKQSFSQLMSLPADCPMAKCFAEIKKANGDPAETKRLLDALEFIKRLEIPIEGELQRPDRPIRLTEVRTFLLSLTAVEREQLRPNSLLSPNDQKWLRAQVERYIALEVRAEGRGEFLEWVGEKEKFLKSEIGRFRLLARSLERGHRLAFSEFHNHKNDDLAAGVDWGIASFTGQDTLLEVQAKSSLEHSRLSREAADFQLSLEHELRVLQRTRTQFLESRALNVKNWISGSEYESTLKSEYEAFQSLSTPYKIQIEEMKLPSMFAGTLIEDFIKERGGLGRQAFIILPSGKTVPPAAQFLAHVALMTDTSAALNKVIQRSDRAIAILEGSPEGLAIAGGVLLTIFTAGAGAGVLFSSLAGTAYAAGVTATSSAAGQGYRYAGGELSLEEAGRNVLGATGNAALRQLQCSLPVGLGVRSAHRFIKAARELGRATSATPLVAAVRGGSLAGATSSGMELSSNVSSYLGELRSLPEAAQTDQVREELQKKYHLTPSKIIMNFAVDTYAGGLMGVGGAVVGGIRQAASKATSYRGAKEALGFGLDFGTQLSLQVGHQAAKTGVLKIEAGQIAGALVFAAGSPLLSSDRKRAASQQRQREGEGEVAEDSARVSGTPEEPTTTAPKQREGIPWEEWKQALEPEFVQKLELEMRLNQVIANTDKLMGARRFIKDIPTELWPEGPLEISSNGKAVYVGSPAQVQQLYLAVKATQLRAQPRNAHQSWKELLELAKQGESGPTEAFADLEHGIMVLPKPKSSGARVSNRAGTLPIEEVNRRSLAAEEWAHLKNGDETLAWSKKLEYWNRNGYEVSFQDGTVKQTKVAAGVKPRPTKLEDLNNYLGDTYSLDELILSNPRLRRAASPESRSAREGTTREIELKAPESHPLLDQALANTEVAKQQALIKQNARLREGRALINGRTPDSLPRFFAWIAQEGANLPEENRAIFAHDCLKLDAAATVQHLASFSLIDQEILSGLASVCSEQSPGITAKYFRNFGLTNEQRSMEVALSCLSKDPDTTLRNLDSFGFKTRETLLTIYQAAGVEGWKYAVENEPLTEEELRTLTLAVARAEPHQLAAALAMLPSESQALREEAVLYCLAAGVPAGMLVSYMTSDRTIHDGADKAGIHPRAWAIWQLSLPMEKRKTAKFDEASATAVLIQLTQMKDFANFEKELLLAIEICDAASVLHFLGDPEEKLIAKLVALSAFGRRMEPHASVSNKPVFSRLLREVTGDRSFNPDGTSLTLFLRMTSRDLVSPEELSRHLRDLRSLPSAANSKLLADLGQRLEEFPTLESAFTSWKRLRAYNNLCLMIVHQKKDLVELLRRELVAETISAEAASLLSKGHREEAVFVQRKADTIRASVEFYRAATSYGDKTASVKAIADFVLRPAEFYQRTASAAVSGVHETKTPSNFIATPNLALSAEELRDAFIAGSLDNIQVLPSLTVEYQLPSPTKSQEMRANDIIRDDIKTLIIKASPRNPRERKAATASGQWQEEEDIQRWPAWNRQKEFYDRLLFIVAEDLHLSKGFHIKRDFLDAQVTLSPAAEQKIRILLCELNDIRLREFVVTTHKKSSLRSAFSGNDIACCMPFGDGKTTVYMFNPNCVTLTVEEKLKDGGRKVVAQSIVTLSANMRTNTQQLLRDLYLPDAEPLHLLFPRDPAECELVFDSVEVNLNFMERPGSQAALEVMCRDFAKRLLTEPSAPERMGVSIRTDRAIIGGVGILREGADGTRRSLIDNSFLPLVPMSYLDNRLPTSIALKLEASGWATAPLSPNKEGLPQVSPFRLGVPSSPFVLPLTYRDTLRVARVEGEAYLESQQFVRYLHKMQNEILAAEIANAHRGNPNLSLKYVDSEGRLRGYLLAWEGVSDSAEGFDGAPVVHVADLAFSNPKSLAAGRLILTFLDNYKRQYLDTGSTVPIYAHFRDKTAYRLFLEKQGEIEARWGVKLNVKVLETQLVPNSNEPANPEKVFRVIITPVGEAKGMR